MNPKLTEIQSSPTTECAMIPLDHPGLAAYRHLMGIPVGIDQSLSASSHSYALDAPTLMYALDTPTRSHVLGAPTLSYAPTLMYALDAPTRSHVLDAPTLSYALDAPTLVYALDAPTGSYVLDAPTLTYALDAPRRTYALDARAMTATTADVQDLPAAYVFVVDMPGVGSAELKVQVENDNVLVISGERKREVGTYLCMERRLGKLTKMFVLPKNANAEAVSAVCKDGVITVTVEKRPPQETKKPKAIEVKIA